VGEGTIDNLHGEVYWAYRNIYGHKDDIFPGKLQDKDMQSSFCTCYNRVIFHGNLHQWTCLQEVI